MRVREDEVKNVFPFFMPCFWKFRNNKESSSILLRGTNKFNLTNNQMKKYIVLLILCFAINTASAQQNRGAGWQFKRIEWKKSHKAKKGLKVKRSKGSHKKHYIHNQKIRRQRSCAAYR